MVLDFAFAFALGSGPGSQEVCCRMQNRPLCEKIILQQSAPTTTSNPSTVSNPMALENTSIGRCPVFSEGCPFPPFLFLSSSLFPVFLQFLFATFALAVAACLAFALAIYFALALATDFALALANCFALVFALGTAALVVGVPFGAVLLVSPKVANAKDSACANASVVVSFVSFGSPPSCFLQGFFMATNRPWSNLCAQV